MNIQQAHQLTTNLMTTHNLTGWHFELTRARNRFGSCSYTQKAIRLSEPLTKLNNQVQVRDVILHEIAHALVGPGNHHNQIWQQKAVNIGCDGKRLYSSEKVIQPTALYSTICPNGHTSQRNQKSRVSCGRCSSRFNKKYLLKFTKNI